MSCDLDSYLQEGVATPLRVIYFEQPDEFDEVDDFVHVTTKRYGSLTHSLPHSLTHSLTQSPAHSIASHVRRYNLDLVQCRGSFADGLAQTISTHGSRAFVLGTRRGDPNGAKMMQTEPLSSAAAVVGLLYPHAHLHPCRPSVRTAHARLTPSACPCSGGAARVLPVVELDARVYARQPDH